MGMKLTARTFGTVNSSFKDEQQQRRPPMSSCKPTHDHAPTDHDTPAHTAALSQSRARQPPTELQNIQSGVNALPTAAETHMTAQPDGGAWRRLDHSIARLSDQSKGGLIEFKDKRVLQESSEVPSGQSTEQHHTDLDPIFMLLEENIVTFVKNELKRVQRVLNPDYDEVVLNSNEDQTSSREAFLKITLNFLRRMKQEELADCLQSRTSAPMCQHKLKSNLKKKFQCVFEGISKAGNPTL
ncbi:protein NLRC3-like protein [Lates japonicus]|uniref:Protein NLRC3-like protein n=1 Tax=Lates japonicus TaxID=270547 RepID=A0AAD3NPC7_LATJO|nr:protein NLRC3-like protein [Lates japonicus]